MGLFTRRSAHRCPNCDSEFFVEAGLFADDFRYVCKVCGARIDVTIKWGVVTEITRSWGYRGLDPKTILPEELIIKPDWNVGYWKERYGDDYVIVHDEWMAKREAWCKKNL